MSLSCFTSRFPRSFGFLFSFKYKFIYLLAVLGLCCCMGFSLVAESWACSLVVVRGLCIAVVSLVAERRL